MILLIIGLHFILGSIWLLNNNQPWLGVLCFLLGMAATHFGWKDLHNEKRRKGRNNDEGD